MILQQPLNGAILLGRMKEQQILHGVLLVVPASVSWTGSRSDALAELISQRRCRAVFSLVLPNESDPCSAGLIFCAEERTRRDGVQRRVALSVVCCPCVARWSPDGSGAARRVV